jgi:hypothetical protein
MLTCTDVIDVNWEETNKKQPTKEITRAISNPPTSTGGNYQLGA